MSGSEPHAYFTGNGTYRAINPIVSRVGDFTPFYIAVAICTVILAALLILNITCCCSRYSDYWLDRHTGNRWLISIWSATPHKQPPLDLTELENGPPPEPVYHPEARQSLSRQPLTPSRDYLELHRRESDI